MAFDAIPVIDMSPALTDPIDAAFAEEFTTACHDVGFALVTNHGVMPELRAELFDLMQKFFELPTADKERIAKANSPWMRGWEPVGAETTDNQPDVREQIDVWTSHEPMSDPVDDWNRMLGPNQWLRDEVLPGHQKISERWIAALANVADRLMATLAIGLGLDADHFRSLFGSNTMSLAKFIHYPPTPPLGAGVNPHHDAGFLTVLVPGPQSGLQVQNPEGSWIDVPAHEDAFVINLGEIIQAMSGNYLVATPHRVITTDERWSTGYFHGPSLDMPLAPLSLDPRFSAAVAASPRHRDAGFMPTPEEAAAGTGAMGSGHTPTTYGEQLWNYFWRSYPDEMARHHGPIAPV